ncbi:hypothetical protein GMJLKIPL_2900 [Methylobacterium isbiliense]|uniref:Uncharacterized protein n=1 Tax=Methylobacterium isbiliense TaxID=315478 RepID=A0ABQ4SCL9_9HYPH|nr:hypothetical protein GMJLKIPL_2900 [Methylobacterium isbiliense]
MSTRGRGKWTATRPRRTRRGKEAASTRCLHVVDILDAYTPWDSAPANDDVAVPRRAAARLGPTGPRLRIVSEAGS